MESGFSLLDISKCFSSLFSLHVSSLLLHHHLPKSFFVSSFESSVSWIIHQYKKKKNGKIVFPFKPFLISSEIVIFVGYFVGFFPILDCTFYGVIGGKVQYLLQLQIQGKCLP
ncbi:unnamed protein product [Coffea canephora]|uniref:Uncharacterized protein n=1 Tax=Coffea canephora TaxID=49390 RepID=A0A068U9P0_COFCA|nr:unnamed protein product [Coffea canephora]